MTDARALVNREVHARLSDVREGEALRLTYLSEGADGGERTASGPVVGVERWGERVQYVDVEDAREDRVVRVDRAGRVATVRSDGAKHSLGPAARIHHEPQD